MNNCHYAHCHDDVHNIVDFIRRRKCNEMRHYALFLPHGIKDGRNKLSFGENYKQNGRPSVHAEHDALLKLMRNRNKPRQVDLYVIRLSKWGVLGNSRPCYNCIMRMMMCDIKINTVYYSNENGEIVNEKFSTMINDPNIHISNGYRFRLKQTILGSNAYIKKEDLDQFIEDVKKEIVERFKTKKN